MRPPARETRIAPYVRAPWHDPRGQVSMLKASVFGLLFVPGALLAVDFASGSLGPRPTEALVHETGLWAIRLLLASLAVTPLRAAWRRPELRQLRRMVGDRKSTRLNSSHAD